MVEWIMEPNWLVPLMIRKNGNDARVVKRLSKKLRIAGHKLYEDLGMYSSKVYLWIISIFRRCHGGF